MEFPEDVLTLIKEYSMPVTRPDWRTLQLMTYDKYLTEYHDQYIARSTYINNHPERHNMTHLFRLCRYKNVFCGNKYNKMFYKN